MSTTLFNAEALVAGTTMASAEVTDVGDLVLDFDLATIVNTKNLGIEVVLKAHEGSNSYKVVTLENKPLFKKVIYTDGFRESIQGINTEKMKLYVTVPPSVTGTMTVVYNKTVNAIPSA